MKKQIRKFFYNVRREVCLVAWGFHDCPPYLRRNWGKTFADIAFVLALSIIGMACSVLFIAYFI